MSKATVDSPVGRRVFDTTREAWEWVAGQLDDYVARLTEAGLPIHADLWHERYEDAVAKSLTPWASHDSIYDPDFGVWTVRE